MGVGKSSLLEVTMYRMYQASLAARAGELYLPAVERFQPQKDIDAFESHILRTVAQTLIKHEAIFKFVGLESPDTDELNKWINATQYKNW